MSRTVMRREGALPEVPDCEMVLNEVPFCQLGKSYHKAARKVAMALLDPG
jgi:hypothetical protein